VPPPGSAHRRGVRTASICGCGRRATAARWRGRWRVRCRITTAWAAPGAQALIKIRPVAGDAELGNASCAPSNRLCIANISLSPRSTTQAMKRRIEQKTAQGGNPETQVKTGTGASATSSSPFSFCSCSTAATCVGAAAQHPGAMAALEQAGCLTHQEYRVLEDAYRSCARPNTVCSCCSTCRRGSCRRARRAAQARAAHGLRACPEERVVVPRSRRRGRPQPARPDDSASGRPRAAAGPPGGVPSGLARQDRADAAHPRPPAAPDVRRRGRPRRAGVRPHPRPNPEPETIRAVLGRYPFRDVDAAYANLAQLANEVPFCRRAAAGTSSPAWRRRCCGRSPRRPT